MVEFGIHGLESGAELLFYCLVSMVKEVLVSPTLRLDPGDLPRKV
jgi:hypothetical protein